MQAGLVTRRTVLGVVAELEVREEQDHSKATTASAGLVEQACHFHHSTLQPCLQLEVGVMGALIQVQVLLMAQGLAAQALSMVSP
jgi:hypothetical protein